MSIPESQLQTWSHLGAGSSSQTTHQSIRNALCGESSLIRYKDFDVYLQGSYRNSTNIRGDSDVDVVVQLNNTFQHDLSDMHEYEKTLFHSAYSNATYYWNDFRRDVLQTLREYYGHSSVSEGNKSLKVAGGSGRLSSDILVCLQYRKYKHFSNTNDQDYVEGVVFYDMRDNRKVINYPKLHYQNGVNKNYNTDSRYKPTVRMIKNARTYLVNHHAITNDLAPSYFLECFIYNASNSCFKTNCQDTYLDVIRWLLDNYQNCSCQSEMNTLFGSSQEQWSPANAIKFLGALIDLWKEW